MSSDYSRRCVIWVLNHADNLGFGSLSFLFVGSGESSLSTYVCGWRYGCLCA